MKTTLFIFSLVLLSLVCCQTKQSTQIVKDLDGNIYHTVTIGTQTWMVENLRVTKYRDGSPILMLDNRTLWVNDSIGAYCYYNNDSANGKIYGLLYNGPAILNPKKLAPEGWHIPSDEEWQKMIDYLGGENVAGGKLKEKGNAHWLENVGATNQSGFSALPAGQRDANIQVNDQYNSFDWLGLRTFFASSTEWGDKIVWVRNLQNLNGRVNRIHGGGSNGISVRCVRD